MGAEKRRRLSREALAGLKFFQLPTYAFHLSNWIVELFKGSPGKMETDSGAQTTNQTQTDSLSPSPNPVSPVPLNNPTSAPRFGTVIPNRIFVGGIDFKTNENDLRKFFAQYGSVKEVKIVNDRAGVSKGYGFITFETQEDAQKILQEAEKLNYKDKKLNIGPAIRKQQVGIPRSSIMPAAGTMYLTTSTGYPYTYHNGVAYFHTPEVASVPPPWPSRSISSSPVMVAQPVYQQPAYHYQAPAQCLPGQWQWGVPQSPASSAPFLYLQPSEVIYQPVEIAQDGGCVPPPLSLMEASVPEPYSDHGVQATYHQVYAQSAIAMPAPVMQPEPIKEPRLHSVRRSFSQPSSVGLKPRYTRSPHFHPRKEFRAEDSILTPPSSTDSIRKQA
ncbi:protein boule-like isoform X8 [Sarcophilus harrisii]|uniref:protein boule-like isoform X8 n=1 Tax=Sarcophilus harrisii TaxID=9305 RepID=UPI001301EE7A|nr:protein boule-like isoform X8 [Sarcophilus harrisii]